MLLHANFQIFPHVRKRCGQVVMATVVACQLSSPLFFVLDKISGPHLLVCKGAIINLILVTLTKRPVINSRKYSLNAVKKDDKNFQRTVTCLWIRSSFSRMFIIVDVLYFILGTNFLTTC